MAKIGDLCETRGEITMEWRIKDFASLSQEQNIQYYSPTFYFSGASWYIMMYPNGLTKEKSEGCLGLSLIRGSSGSAVRLHLSLSIKRIDEKNDLHFKGTVVFHDKDYGWGKQKIISRLDLMERNCYITASGTLIVLCCLKNNELNDVAGSLFSRQQQLSDNLKQIYRKRKRTDSVLKVDGSDIPTHRMILEARSPVFSAMFKHDMEENKTGEIHITDVGKNTMETILEYMYSGDIKNLNVEEALSTYAAAEKYDIKNVKEICAEFIINKLSVDCVCDVIAFGKLYQDEKLGHRAREYFKENVRKILRTEKWRTFSEANHDICMELLSSVVTALAPE